MTSNGKSTHASNRELFAKRIPTVVMAAPPSVPPPPHCKTILVTPELAAKWLLKNTSNRAVRKGRVKAFARDMKAGAWSFNPQPISFGTDDGILDGQHRLLAIIESGVSVQMAVWFDVPVASRSVMDLGTPRGLRDVAGISVLEAAVVMAMMRGMIKMPIIPTMAERAAFYRRFSTEIDSVFLIYRSSRHGLRQAAVYAAICRAMFHVPLEELELFCKVLESGMPNGEDRDATVIRLRDRLTEPTRAVVGGRHSLEVYAITTSAIRAFVEGRVLSKIYATSTDLYPLPDADVA